MTPQPQIETASIEPKGYKWKALAIVGLGTVMVAMDVSINNIAFPVLTQFFKKDLATVMWISLAFVLTSSSLMLIVGKIGDLFGRKRIYVALQGQASSAAKQPSPTTTMSNTRRSAAT